jgi:hypothetical protein
LHSTDDEKLVARQAVEALIKHRRGVGLSIILKAHVIKYIHVISMTNMEF